jgi:hypothetical protein
MARPPQASIAHTGCSLPRHLRSIGNNGGCRANRMTLYGRP